MSTCELRLTIVIEYTADLASYGAKSAHSCAEIDQKGISGLALSDIDDIFSGLSFTHKVEVIDDEPTPS